MFIVHTYVIFHLGFFFNLHFYCRIAEEYFIQTDEEKRKGMPIVMPMFDRYKQMKYFHT